MLVEAEQYLRSFPWCPPVGERYVGLGIGDVIALFLFEFREKIQGTEDWLWVVVGDLPSAYFVIDGAPDPASALETYCQLIEDWTRAVRNGHSLEEVYPVAAEPTLEHASMLSSRIAFIRSEFVPRCAKTSC
jgi:hypothetical protein